MKSEVEIKSMDPAQSTLDDTLSRLKEGIFNLGTWDELAKFLASPVPDTEQEKAAEVAKHYMEKQKHFIAEEDSPTILLTSFPRSGNTLIRSLVEMVTGTFSGSDCDKRRRLNKELFELGLQGEGKTGDEVLFVKSHFPERMGSTEFKVQKVVVIVRNPLDSLSSLFNMIATCSHSESITPEKFKMAEVQELWSDFIKQEPPVWEKFHNYWTKAPQRVYTHIIRYEDLKYHTREALIELFKFILELEQLDNTIVELLIGLAVESQQKQQVYKPRKGQVGENVEKFAPEQLCFVEQECRASMEKFGYTLSNNQADLCKQCFQGKWIADFNAKMLKAVVKMSPEKKAKFKLKVNNQAAIVREKTESDPNARGARSFKKRFEQLEL